LLLHQQLKQQLEKVMSKFMTLELAKEWYRESQKLKIKGAIKNQFERASLSVVLNLSEGQAKPTRKDKSKFYFISYGSLRECKMMLELLGEGALYEKADKLAAMVWKVAKNPGGS